MTSDLIPHEEPSPIEIFDQNCVLIVDSCRTSIESLETQFNRQNFRVLSHTRGEYGFETAVRSQPDCILISSQLVDMDGLDLCRMLVDESQTCGIPVIVLGDRSCGSSVQHARQAGCQFFVAKPVDPRSLIFLVNESIAEARSWICE